MMFWLAYCMIRRPVVVSPVNAILAMRGDDARGLPASTPKPLTMLRTPSGIRSPMISTSLRIDQGVCSAGLRTIALPAARAGASFHTAMRIGKFHGMICPTTRTALPLSHVSMTAIASRCSSMRSAILSRTLARSATDVRPHAGAARCAASRAASMSSAVPRAMLVKTWPVTGVGLSKYSPLTGSVQRPPIQWP